MQNESRHLARSIGTIGLVATGISSMIGASIYIVPFMIQKNVPGIGPYVLPAFLFASLPALFAAFAYAILSSAIHRAGGSYVFVSRILHPYWGFIASFSQWFGLSIVIGVVAYMTIPFFAQAATAMGLEEISTWVQIPVHRLVLSLALLWIFIGINILGIQTYQPVVIILVCITFILAGIVIVISWTHTRLDFYKSVLMSEGIALHDLPAPFNLNTFLSASGLLFASFIGFDSIAQAGGEAKNPSRNLPRAIIFTFLIVTLFYLLFTHSVYRLVPWSFMLEKSQVSDISATSLFSYLLSPFWSALIILGACIALMKDLPSMILSVSRFTFSWAKDGLFPQTLTRIHSRYASPYLAILFSGMISTIGILGVHFAGDIFLGIDIMVISMLFNFVMVSISLLNIHQNNPEIAYKITIFKSLKIQKWIGWIGFVLLISFLFFNMIKDISSAQQKWYFHSTWVWTLVMVFGSIIFAAYWNALKQKGIDRKKYFNELPKE